MGKIQRLLRELDIKIEAYEDVLKEDRYIDWEDYHWAKQTKAWLTMPRDEEIEDQTIDIDSIEEIDTSRNYQNYELALEIDKLVRAVKQLNKEIKELKEK